MLGASSTSPSPARGLPPHHPTPSPGPGEQDKEKEGDGGDSLARTGKGLEILVQTGTPLLPFVHSATAPLAHTPTHPVQPPPPLAMLRGQEPSFRLCPSARSPLVKKTLPCQECWSLCVSPLPLHPLRYTIYQHVPGPSPSASDCDLLFWGSKDNSAPAPAAIWHCDLLACCVRTCGFFFFLPLFNSSTHFNGKVPKPFWLLLSCICYFYCPIA